MWCVYRTTNMLNGKTYIGQHKYETHRTREWIKLGYRNAYSVARGRHKSCEGLHFKYIKEGEI